MPFTFPRDLHITTSQLKDLPEADRLAWWQGYRAFLHQRTAEADRRYLEGDYDMIGSNRRQEIGE